MKTLTFQEKYAKEIVPLMQEKFSYKNKYQVPRMVKIVLNTGVGKMVNARRGREQVKNEEDLLKDLLQELALISGQKPQMLRAKRSIAGFKLREGMIVGVRVTLRGARMYDFLARLIHIALPRTRDFRGFPLSSVDEHGNLTIGIREQIIFPEIPHDKVRELWGMEATLVSTARNKEEGTELFKKLGIPFSR